MYIEEIPRLPPSVAEIETAIPAFIGYTEKAMASNSDDLLFLPKRISSLLEYDHLYGGSGDLTKFILYPSLQLFYNNGGGTCYIVSIGGYSDLQKADFIRGLDEIKKNDEATLLLFPDAVNLPGTDLYDVQTAALKQAADLGFRFCILDIKPASTKNDHAAVVKEFRDNIGTDNLKYGAAYTPFLKTLSGNPFALPPSGAVAGCYCMVDSKRGVWKSPANVSLNNVNELLYTIDSNEQDELNVDANGKSVNVIRFFFGRGCLIWGARTLMGNDNEWRYISVRRLFNTVEESVKRSTTWVVFENNDAATWVKVKAQIENYLVNKWREGALQGMSPNEAFFVHVGLGETMTFLDLLEGRLIVEIGMAAIRPAEFIILRFSHKIAGA